MTQEEKAKAYDKALESATKAKNNASLSKGTLRVLDIIFPELKESEDERIRKEIKRAISVALDYSYFDKETANNSLAWLEKQSPKNKTALDKAIEEEVDAWLKKQGQEKHLSEPIKDYQGSFTCWNNAHDFRPKHLQRCICYDKYMKGVYCYVYDDISKYWCTQTTEEHDPDGDNHISDYADYRVPVWMPLPGISFYPSKSWLEKQGEQKPIDMSIKS